MSRLDNDLINTQNRMKQQQSFNDPNMRKRSTLMSKLGVIGGKVNFNTFVDTPQTEGSSQNRQLIMSHLTYNHEETGEDRFSIKTNNYLSGSLPDASYNLKTKSYGTGSNISPVKNTFEMSNEIDNDMVFFEKAEIPIHENVDSDIPTSEMVNEVEG